MLRTPEHNAKIAAALTGRTLSAEHRRHLSERDPNWLRKHGHASRALKSPTWTTWIGMIDRCTNPNNARWNRYGGRGVTVCARWSVFTNFLADMGSRPHGMTIDRKNNDGNYEADNCRWATRNEQNANRSQYSTACKPLCACKRHNRKRSK